MMNVNQFFKILNEGQIFAVYQPIVSLKDGETFGYEALSRIKIPKCDLNIGELFHIASNHNCLWELEKLCRMKALENSVSKPLGTKLFINVDANIINEPEMRRGFTYQKLNEYGLNSEDIIFEITERSGVNEIDTFKASVSHYQSQNFKIAIDDFGSAYSGLNRVCSVSPDFIKLDIDLVRNINKDKRKKSMVAAMIGHCKEYGIKVIAEGIETEEELVALVELKVDYGQGYFIGYPKAKFESISYDKKLLIKGANHKSFERDNQGIFGSINEIIQQGATVQKYSHSISLYEKMCKEPQISEAFVVDENNQVCGIVTRTNLFKRYGGQFGYSLGKRMTVQKLMESEVLAVETSTAIDKVAAMAMERSKGHIYDSIAIVNEGKFIGKAEVKDLLMATINLQLKRASDSSPLTGLPGNSLIQETMAMTIHKDEPWAILYLDLDNFKAYNDIYGFTSGDMMIKAAAKAIEESCCNKEFIGHIGGDDFVIISRSTEVEELCKSIFETFRNLIADLYSKEDWDRGYIVAKNRQGEIQEFDIVTLSIAVLTNEKQKIKNIEEATKVIAEIKKQCKNSVGNSMIVA